MSGTKTALKAAKSALDDHKYEEAIRQAELVLASDSNSYNAHVFLGLAYDKQNRNEDSEKAYKTAIRSKTNEPLAWQGLLTLYEKQHGEKLDVSHDAALTLGKIYMEKDDRNRCQTVLDKYTNDAKKYGSRTQLKRSLEVYLPTGPLYEYLEGRIPQPAQTYSRLAELVEAEEKERVNTEIGQRRTRLGARIDRVKADVRREVLESSQLEALYRAIVDWTNDDEVRRQYEEKLLQHVYDHLTVLPRPGKETKRKQVEKLADGLVILKHPFLLAWSVKLEWADVDNLEELDVGLLREHILLFPDEGRSKVLRGYLESDLSPFSQHQAEPKDEDGDGGTSAILMSAEDRLLLMGEGFEESSSSPLAHRIMGQFYLYLEEYESAATTARRGRDCIQADRNISSLGLSRNWNAMSIILGTALVHYQAPRHHPEARELFEEILSHNHTETSALLGIGLILEEQENYAEASHFLTRALAKSTDPKIRAEAAWCKALNGDHETSLNELNACLSEMESTDPRTKSLRSQTLYRIGMCIWNENTSISARKSRDGAYAQFLASLQADLNFAPAYTSLGIYYADYAKDKKRARKCFQKAFELSSSEIEAAHRLAKAFAKSSEWDLVEVVAQRVIESGAVKPTPGSKKKAISWPFAALGTVQLNDQEYNKSVVSFQSALRITPTDYHSWVGLGESYHHCGRYVAATKAFDQAQKLEIISEDETVKENWFSKYMLANVKRELGEFDDAIADYNVVLESRPNEFGVSIALLQCLVESAWHCIEIGFFGRAANRAREAISVAESIAKLYSGAFNLWKALGDACSVFISVQAYIEDFPCKALKSLLETDDCLEAFDNLADVDGIGRDALLELHLENEQTTNILHASHAAVMAHKRAVQACTNDIHAKAVSWYNLGWAEHRTHQCGFGQSKPSLKKKSMRYLKTSVQCFKRAIELEAGNAEFWNSLGIVTAELNPKVSQHSFVRSLYLNDKNARVWTNLGTLYLMEDDFELANEAFARAQSSDPDYAQAWVGQGLLATHLADPGEARTLFTHAFEIADSCSTIIKRQYAMAAFNSMSSSAKASQSSDVLQPLFALRQLRSQVTADLAFQHLLSLFAERARDNASAISNLDHVSNELESQYEKSESPITLLRFAQTKSDLSRAHLANRDFEAAMGNAETAVDLTNDGHQGNEEHQRIRLSAHMTAGLGYYYQEKLDLAIQMFRSALEETQGDPNIVCLLAQMLWAKGGDQERSVAREQLFDCVENNPGHVDSTVLLGAIAVLDDDEDTVEAVTADLKNLRATDDLSEQKQGKIGNLLTTIAALFPGGITEDLAGITEASTEIMLAPSKPHGWSQLADLHLTEVSYPADMAVLTADKAALYGEGFDVMDLAKTHVGTRRIEDAQRAVMLAPWMASTWDGLQFV
ncbi:Superkiller protein 3 [Lecanora helva]